MHTLILAGSDLLLIARYFDILTLKYIRHDKLIKLCFNKNINYPQKRIVTNSTLTFKNIHFADGYIQKKQKKTHTHKKKHREKLKIS